MFYLPPDLHTAIQMRKGVAGEEMGDIMVGILTDAMSEELEVVGRMRNRETLFIALLDRTRDASATSRVRSFAHGCSCRHMKVVTTMEIRTYASHWS